MRQNKGPDDIGLSRKVVDHKISFNSDSSMTVCSDTKGHHLVSIKESCCHDSFLSTVSTISGMVIPSCTVYLPVGTVAVCTIESQAESPARPMTQTVTLDGMGDR